MPLDARPLLSAVAVAVLVTGGAALTAAPAQAESHVYFLNSRDDGARAQVSVTWSSASRYTANWLNCDIRSDGRGAILYLSQQSPLGTLKEDVYDHDLAGNRTCDNKVVNVNNGWETERLQIRECNGGSRYSPENCDVDYIKNPLDN